jgi:ketosteroid isomerase-like protein
MSRENVEIVRAVYDAVARRDGATVLALYDPEVEWDVSQVSYGELMGGSLYRGHDGLRRWFGEYYEAWETVEHDCEELIDVGEHVISVATGRARGRASGAQVEWHFAGIWTISEGKIARVTWFPTREEALEAAGAAV